MYNAITLKTGYDSFLDQYTGKTFLYRSPSSIGLTKKTQTLEIEPLSEPKDASQEHETYEKTVGSLLTYFGRPYNVITLKVPLTKFGVQLGNTVVLTSAFLPDPSTGILGLASHPCLLVGREWNLATGVGTLTLYAFEFPGHGYAPSARIINASSTDLSAGARTSYRFAITSNFYAPAGKKDVAYFAVGDFIQVQKYDEAGWSGEFIDGTVTAIDTAASTMDVTFGSAMPGGFPGGSATPVYIVHFQIDPPSATANMARYCFVADLTGTITVSGADGPAIRMSP